MPGTAVVVGAGIGGLAAAIGLRATGWEVTLLERAPAVRGTGAGISLWDNGLAALDALGVGAAVRAHGTVRVPGSMRTPGGRRLVRSSGSEFLVLHREDLHAALRAALPGEPAVTGAAVVAVEQTAEAATVVHRSANGALHRVSADLVVGADGVGSRVRGGPPARYAGFTTWRGVTDEPVELDGQSETWGRGAIFGLTRLPDGRVYWFATATLPAGIRSTDERAEVLRRFAGWHAPIREVVLRTAREAVLRHDVHVHPRPLAPFASGRVALLGDAAHAVTPNLGQGGGLALEDAATLAAALAAEPRVPLALARYDAVRRPRAERISALSERMSRLAQTRGRVRTTLRSALLAATPPAAGAAGLARVVGWEPPALAR